MNTQAPVVAGVDTSFGSWEAARYAAEEAQHRELPLVLVHAYTWPWIDLPLSEEEVKDPGPRDKGRHLLARTAGRIRDAYPDLAVTTELVEGNPAAVLIERSRDAGLLVVGHRGEGGFAGLLVGAVAVHAAAHAYCPLVVVRGAQVEEHAPVVVGVDGSVHNDATIRFAAQAATRYKAPLHAVTIGPAHPDAQHAAAVREALTGLLADVLDGYPQVSGDIELRHDRSPAAGLIQAAAGARLVVVGPRGHGGLRGILLGSVGRTLIEHSPCPVAIVRSSP